MRDIKFRAWVNNSKKFEAIEFIGAGQKTFPVYTKGNKYWFPMQGVLEQYTGLKDKNGVEIYEGDVVQYSHYKDFRFIVIFKYGCFYAHNVLGERFMADTLLGSLRASDKLSVIGNIHENADLLEEQS